jgi:hypothetical protein
MITSETPRPFNKRAFLSAALVLSGLMLPVSGLINHQLGFEGMTQARHFWMSVHNVSGLVFTICAVMHGIVNRRALLGYVRKVQGVAVSREAVTAGMLVIGVVSLVASHALHVR